MTTDEARECRSVFQVASEARLRNNKGVQIRLANDAIVNIFDKGTFNVQGESIEEVQALGVVVVSPAALPAAHASAKKKVFVVYGHDQVARDQLEAMLRRWGLEPLILDRLPTEGQTVVEKLELAMKEVATLRGGTPDERLLRRHL